MSDALRASVEKLKQSTSRLNKIADEAGQVVQAVEAFLSKECSVGVFAWVVVSSNELTFDGPVEQTSIGYTRWQGKYRIVVSIGTNEDDDTTKPWVEWDRATKLETVKKLPELVVKVAASVDEYVTAAHAATNTITEVLNALEKKGAK